jgi:hypothetical protein
MNNAPWILIQTVADAVEADMQLIKASAEKIGRRVHIIGLKQLYENDRLPVEPRAVVYGPAQAVVYACETYGWLSWVDTAAQSCTRYYPAFGEHLVNADYVFLPIGDAARRWNWLTSLWPSEGGKLFVRPNDNQKSFAAEVMDCSDIVRLQRAFDPDALIVVAPVKRLHREWRCFMHHDRYLTGSLYRQDGESLRSAQVPAEVIEFANKMAALRYPGLPPVWVVDVAETDDGLRVLEVAGCDSVGFYLSDCDLIVGTISQEADKFYA